MEDKDDILLKIKKVLNLSESARECSTIEEAQAAFSMAQRMLKKHHLSMSQVIAFDNSPGRESSEFMEINEQVAVEYKASVVPRWMHKLILAVNLLTDTKCLIKRVSKDGERYFDMKIVYVGDVMDVAMAVELFTFLRTTITKLSTKHIKQLQQSTFKNWRSFAEGCSSRIYERAEEQDKKISDYLDPFSNVKHCDIDSRIIDDDEEEDLEDDFESDFGEFKTETGLVQYNKYRDEKFEKIKEFMDNIEAEKEHISSSTAKRLDEQSYQMGIDAGNTIQLQVQKKLDKTKNKEKKNEREN